MGLFDFGKNDDAELPDDDTDDLEDDFDDAMDFGDLDDDLL